MQEAGEEAARIERRLAALPAEQSAAAGAVAEAERELAELRAVAEALPPSDEPEAARAAQRARDRVRGAERRLAHARAELERLEHEAEELEAASAALAVRVRELADTLAQRPGLGDLTERRPGESLEEIAAWATEARAALLVARSGLVSQRDAVIRQANELGSLVLGEPLAARSPADVARLLAGRR